MKVSEILKTKGNSVETIDPGASVTEAVRRLVGPPQIGALVVCTPGRRKVTGMINERDVLRGLGRHGTRLLELTVAEVMSRRVPVCSPDDSVVYVMREMTRLRHRHLPVLEGGELAGVVSIGDVVKNRVAEIELETGVLRDAYIGRRV